MGKHSEFSSEEWVPGIFYVSWKDINSWVYTSASDFQGDRACCSPYRKATNGSDFWWCNVDILVHSGEEKRWGFSGARWTHNYFSPRLLKQLWWNQIPLLFSSALDKSLNSAPFAPRALGWSLFLTPQTLFFAFVSRLQLPLYKTRSGGEITYTSPSHYLRGT